MSLELQDDEAAALTEHLQRELRYYEREKIACWLKSCASLQLFGAMWYAFAAPLPMGHGFGVLSGGAAVVVFASAHNGKRVWLRIAFALSGAVLAAALWLAWGLYSAAGEVGQNLASSRRLLLCFTTLTLLLALLQVPTLRMSKMLLLPPPRRRAAAEDDAMLLPSGEVHDLLHVDLSRTPPEAHSP